MKKILRSVIDVDGSISPDDLQQNLFHLSDCQLEFLKEEDQKIWSFVYDFAMSYSKAPDVNSIRNHFENENELEVLNRLDEIEMLDETYTKADFENLVKKKLEDQYNRKTEQLLKEAAHILNEGKIEREDGEEVYHQGYQDAIQYVLQRSDELMTAADGMAFRRDITEDYDELRDEFEKTISNLGNAFGRLTGLDPIDDACRGANPGDLWIHAGFTSELKTAFALNWAYKTAFIFKRNVYFISLEQTVEQIRRIIAVMHSSHPKFDREPLDYRKIRDGVDETGQNEISEDEKQFFYDVLDDWERGAERNEYGSLIVECPDRDRATIPSIKQRVEMTHQSTPIHLLFIDYLGLVQPHQNRRDFFQNLNSIIRATKQMALNFADGEKIPIVGLHQMNREGKKEAERNDGRYRKDALADANEAERTADVITYTYLDQELRRNNEVKIGCLKNRDNPMFDLFHAHVDYRNRFINDLVETDEEGNTGFDVLND